MYLVGTTSGDKKYVLRPELTASVGRIALEHRWTHSLPKRVWYHGAVFRHERPQHNRYRQFYQIGAEFLGGPEVSSDLDILYSGLQILNVILGPESMLEVEVNSIGDAHARDKYKTVLKEWLTSPNIWNTLEEEDRLRAKTNPLRVMDSKSFQASLAYSNAPQLTPFLSEESMRSFNQILEGLSMLGVHYKVVPSLVRGLDYYNDFCFEVKPKREKQTNKQVTLLAGGRYDTLLGTLAKDHRKNIKAVG